MLPSFPRLYDLCQYGNESKQALNVKIPKTNDTQILRSHLAAVRARCIAVRLHNAIESSAGLFGAVALMVAKAAEVFL